MTANNTIREIILKHFPAIQAAYLFGSHGTEYEQRDSDVDLGLLLNHTEVKDMKGCRLELEEFFKKNVELINLRKVNTVFQFQIITTGRKILVADETETDVFEMQTLSKYQKLSQERADILSEIQQSKKILQI